MSKRIQPMGTKLIVLPLNETMNQLSEGGIEMVNLILEKGKVVEVGTELKDVYKEGDIVIYPEKRGTAQPYQKKNMIWLDGKPFSSFNACGDIYGVEKEENIPQDKGDSL